ncbi:MAG: hypothetical protein LQ348_007763 [Seirophora lacunosa]|nr:MAG: hypothetical protein LQ348_007763 [Seirophora lacunosa]
MAHCRLLSCPHEIIVRIVDDLFPEDLVSFALTNKATRSVSELALQKHQALMKQYSSIRFGDAENTWDGDKFDTYHPLYLLEAILQNPKIAHYPIKIHLTAGYTDWYEFEDDSERDRSAAIISTLKPEIAALGTENRWLYGEARRQAWAGELLVPTNHAYHMAVLLTMLPHLELIKFTSMSNGVSQPVREIVWAIAAANQDPTSPVHEQALMNLLEISLDCGDTKYGEDITMYAPFTALPSLRFVHGWMIEGLYSQEGQRCEEWYEGPKVPQPKQIEDMHLTHSAIDLHAWKWMFQTVGNKLKRFTYDHVDVLGDTGAFYDCVGIIELLKTHARHSLRRLEITADEYSEDEDFFHDTGETVRNTRFVGDLKAFTTLRVLILDDTAFQKQGRGAIVRLIDVLPPSIRVVRLLREIKVGDPADLFAGLANGKKELLPELKRIGLMGDYTLHRRVVDECKAVGIEIAGPCLQIVDD